MTRRWLIRPATATDLRAINDIYNYSVLHSTCTYQEEPEPLAGRRKWFRLHGPKHPVIVAEIDGDVVAWGSLSPWHIRSAYRHTVENSIYVHHKHQGRGLGSALLKELIHRARGFRYRVIIAVIDSDQPASIALHKKFGFSKVGHFKGIGFKFRRWRDVIYMQLTL